MPYQQKCDDCKQDRDDVTAVVNMRAQAADERTENVRVCPPCEAKRVAEQEMVLTREIGPRRR